MKCTYVKQFFGTIDAVEMAVKTFDKVFRARYNVHGGRREASYKTPEGEYTVIMSYTANWMDSPQMKYLFPEYTIKGIEKTFNHLSMKIPDTENCYFYCDIIKEVPDVEKWRKGEA